MPEILALEIRKGLRFPTTSQGQALISFCLGSHYSTSQSPNQASPLPQTGFSVFMSILLLRGSSLSSGHNQRLVRSPSGASILPFLGIHIYFNCSYSTWAHLKNSYKISPYLIRTLTFSKTSQSLRDILETKSNGCSSRDMGLIPSIHKTHINTCTSHSRGSVTLQGLRGTRHTGCTQVYMPLT